MRLLIIRHGDPNYEKDTLTERGWREARLLSERLCKMDIQEFYVSPLGRAQATASCTLEKMNRTAITHTWLREFAPSIQRPDGAGTRTIAWDWLPQDWTGEASFYDRSLWMQQAIMDEGAVGPEYQWVTSNFDSLLAEHGYVRDGGIYLAERANRDTLAFFCHFGLECVLLSHLMGVSPMILWHHTAAAPTSVTTVYTEERREGTAIFRVSSFGDTSHLYAAGEEPSFAARFCETFHDTQEPHD
ncbi:MAG: histidine phosphatase family protein [Lachnospiraceae bacterium]|nr:histidine phosphatase family protein [Lachnospiraceae bacterium]